MAFSSFGLVGVSSVNLLAVEVQYNDNRTISANGQALPVIQITYKPRPGSVNPNRIVVIKVLSVNEIPRGVQPANYTGFWTLAHLADNTDDIFFIYNPFDDVVYRPVENPGNVGWTDRILNDFENSAVYKSFLRLDETIDFLNVEGLTGAITQSVGKMIAVGLLLGIGLLGVKVGVTSLDKFLDNKFWYKRFENERSALEKEYNRLSRVYRNDPQGQKNLDRRFARRNTRLYEKYADYGVEKEDLIRTE